VIPQLKTGLFNLLRRHNAYSFYDGLHPSGPAQASADFVFSTRDMFERVLVARDSDGQIVRIGGRVVEQEEGYVILGGEAVGSALNIDLLGEIKQLKDELAQAQLKIGHLNWLLDQDWVKEGAATDKNDDDHSIGEPLEFPPILGADGHGDYI